MPGFNAHSAEGAGNQRQESPEDTEKRISESIRTQKIKKGSKIKAIYVIRSGEFPHDVDGVSFSGNTISLFDKKLKTKPQPWNFRDFKSIKVVD